MATLAVNIHQVSAILFLSVITVSKIFRFEVGWMSRHPLRYPGKCSNISPKYENFILEQITLDTSTSPSTGMEEGSSSLTKQLSDYLRDIDSHVGKKINHGTPA